MTEKNLLSLDSSILYRCSQKYYEKQLSEYDLGYTQIILLTEIFENEGLTMNELANSGAFDKTTVTKAIQRLEQLEYVRIENSEEDKRSKQLYTTEKAREIMPRLYLVKQEWFNYLSRDLSDEDKDKYFEIMAKLNSKAIEFEESEHESSRIKFYGLQKLTLLDYPGKMAATLFTGGCNFRCPFCHNKSLVYLNESEGEISRETILEYLDKRKGILDGVCITGGEPTLYPGLRDFIETLKSLGLLVKLDTNGTNFDKLKELVDGGLVDYVAMDIKNCPKKYSMTVGLENYDLTDIEKSVSYLLENHVDYEFRTTVVKEFHEPEDMKEIGEWIKGAKNYYLQQFEDHGTCIVEGLNPHDASTMREYRDILKEYVLNVEIRGMKE